MIFFPGCPSRASPEAAGAKAFPSEDTAEPAIQPAVPCLGVDIFRLSGNPCKRAAGGNRSSPSTWCTSREAQLKPAEKLEGPTGASGLRNVQGADPPLRTVKEITWFCCDLNPLSIVTTVLTVSEP